MTSKKNEKQTQTKLTKKCAEVKANTILAWESKYVLALNSWEYWIIEEASDKQKAGVEIGRNWCRKSRKQD